MSRDLRVNQMIRISPVRVVDENGSQLGVMPTPQALAMAQDRGLDLVEVAPMASPPVVRFLDFGQYKYELAKREKEAKRRSRAVEFKEVRLRPKIGTGDFDTKVHRAIEFLEDGDRLKVTVQFRGREMTHPEIGRGLLERFVERIKDHGVVERAPLMEGRSMHLTVASVHKPKAADHKAEVKTDATAGPTVGAAATAEPPAPAEPVAAAAEATAQPEPDPAPPERAAKPEPAAKVEPAPKPESPKAEPPQTEPAPKPEAAAKVEPAPKPESPKAEPTKTEAPTAATGGPAGE